MCDESAEKDVPVDFRRLDEITDGDVEFEQELWRTFTEGCLERLGNLERAIAANNGEQTRREAHAMRGASANIGAKRLEEYSRTLENVSTTGDASEWKPLYESIHEEVNAVFVYYRDYRHIA